MQNHTVSHRVKFAQACLFHFYLLQCLSLSLNVFFAQMGTSCFVGQCCSLFNKPLIDSYLGGFFFFLVGGERCYNEQEYDK